MSLIIGRITRISDAGYKRLDAKIQAMSINQPKVEVKTALVVLMKDNLTKAERALMTPKQLCPSNWRTDNQKEGTDRREGSFNTDKAERNNNQEEHGVCHSRSTTKTKSNDNHGVGTSVITR